MNEIVLNHPLITHKLAILRDVNTGTKEFRELVTEISTLLCYEATKDAKLEETEIETPLAKMKTGKLNEDNYAVVPILRAGMGMVEGIINVIPNAKVGHIGLYRNEETFEPVEYYYKMPEGIKVIETNHPDVQIYCAVVDKGLNENKYIVPGLGDAGDRIYGTK